MGLIQKLKKAQVALQLLACSTGHSAKAISSHLTRDKQWQQKQAHYKNM